MPRQTQNEGTRPRVHVRLDGASVMARLRAARREDKNRAAVGRWRKSGSA